jgi:L-alanine-DL-glutamate epimerase-like enolase superfamily enzyme
VDIALWDLTARLLAAAAARPGAGWGARLRQRRLHHLYGGYGAGQAIDVTRCGGITEFLRGAALAQAHHLEIFGHCAPDLHVRVGAAVPNLRHVEYFHDRQRIERMLFDGALDPAGGVPRPDPGQPGLA